MYLLEYQSAGDELGYFSWGRVGFDKSKAQMYFGLVQVFMHLFDVLSCCFGHRCMVFFLVLVSHPTPDVVFVASLTSVVHLKPAVLEC